MTEDKEVRSNRERQLSRMRQRYPDREFADDEEMYGAIYDDYDQFEHELEDYRGREKQLSEMFASDPRSAKFLSDWHRGKDPVIGLVETFGPEIRDILDDPDMQDKLAEARKDYLERAANSRKLDEEYETNMDQTLETARGFQQKRQLSDDQIDALFSFLLGIIQDGVMGKFSEETLELAYKAMNYDEDVAAAGEEGKWQAGMPESPSSFARADVATALRLLAARTAAPALIAAVLTYSDLLPRPDRDSCRDRVMNGKINFNRR